MSVSSPREINGVKQICIVDIRGSDKLSGTQKMQSVIKDALDIQTQVELDATWRSHIFHLKMGFIPLERKIPAEKMYTEYKAGF